MKLTFEIEYHISEPGQYIVVVGNTPALGSGDPKKGAVMTDTGNGRHRLEIEVSAAKESVSYRYSICAAGETVRTEWGPDRTVKFDSRLQSALIIDHWKDIPSDKPFYSTLMTECVFRRTDSHPVHSLKPSMLQIEVEAAMIPNNTVLAIVGSEPEIGAWNPDEAVLMTSTKMPYWKVQLPLEAFVGRHTEYKFILLSEQTGEVVGWEAGQNRHIDIPDIWTKEAMIVSGLHFNNPLPLWHGAGTAIPVFSLRSNDDFGVGDFYDLKLMVDWAAETGQSVVQVLPINDTTMTNTWRDCYPYNANSCFALHPMYLRLSAMGKLDNKTQQEEFDRLAAELNSLDTVDYERVNEAKNRYTRLLFDLYGERDLASEEFKKFYDSNRLWLKPYAAFCTLRDQFNTANFNDWGEWSTFSASRIDRLMKKKRREFDYHFYLQFHLDRQLREVRDYAHTKGVALKGDIPIGISRNSVEAWTDPELFNLDCSAGAPPDPFATLGQNWGFPTYNWERMAQDNYGWWKARLRKMAEYFDAYRIDHVLGFFRIWEIPTTEIHGLLGTFNPALPLSAEEMKSRYGFLFDANRMIYPYASERLLEKLFGENAQIVKTEFTSGERVDGIYRLTDDVATQRRAVETIETRFDGDKKQALSVGMLNLLDEVLFIEDRRHPGLYHPRIDGLQTFAFEQLSAEMQHTYRTLYEDYFYHRNDSLWREKAMEKLPRLIDATQMLSCAEDLGMIPMCVPKVMEQLKILSLEIQRMPKAFEEFARPLAYPYLSVCSTSTHDMAPLRGWLAQDSERAKRFASGILNLKEDEADESSICNSTIRQHLQSPSMLCILPLQDWLSIDGELRHPDPHAEQINDPANSSHYWRYRMHLTLDRLLSARTYNSTLREMIASSGR